MKILILHNRYQHAGGEDAVFQAEVNLLAEYGHVVETLVFDNSDIHSFVDKLKIGFGSSYNPASAAKLEHSIHGFLPDIIHVHNFFPVASPAVFYVAEKQNIPIVQTLHNYRLLCSNALFFRDGKVCEDCYGKAVPLDGIRQGCYRSSKLQTASLVMMTALHNRLGTWQNRVAQYIALTEFARQKFLGSHLGLDPSQVSVKPNFSFDPALVMPDQKSDFFLYVGRLSVEKGIVPFLEAVRDIHCPVKILGNGPFVEQVQALSDQYSHIEFLGYRSKDEVLALLKQARALIFPSICYEGFPVSVVEALACGTPVVASNIGGIPEIITDLQNGLLFEAGNIRQMVDTIKLISQEDELWRSMCFNARKTYEARYTPEQNYQMLIQVYRQAIRSLDAKKSSTAITNHQ
jgi:glycosyltransferase involved in cell wall biosynthesis